MNDARIHLDAGALIALERQDRRVWARLRTLAAAQEPPLTAEVRGGTVWTSDVDDISALATHARRRVVVAAV